MKLPTTIKFTRLFCILICIILSASLVLFAACSNRLNLDDKYEDPFEKVEEGDEEDIEVQVIKNGKFDLYNETSSTVFPVNPKDWSYSADSFAGSNAPTSSGDFARYGIISVDEDIYKTDLSKFQTYSMKNKAGGAVTLDNPGAPSQFYDPSKEAGEGNNDKILMVQNIKPTAAKYKSSSITVPQNSFAKISVFVKTVFVKADGEYFEYGTDNLSPGQGATIAITGGVNYPVILTEIYTDLDTNNGWAEYQFIIEGSNMSSKTVNLELGLGTGGPLNSQGYIEGFAFFSNAVMEFIPQKEFNKLNDTLDASNADVEIIEIFYNSTLIGTQNTAYKRKQVSDKKQRVSFSFNKDYNDTILANTGISVLDYTNAAKPNSKILSPIDMPYAANYNVETYSDILLMPNMYEDTLKEYPFSNEGIIAIDKKNNTNTSVGLGYYDFINVKENEFYKISFWLKTSELQSGSVSIYLYYHEIGPDGVLNTYSKQIVGIDTTKHNLSEEDKKSVLNGDKYDGWRQYSFYVDGGLFDYNGTNSKDLSLEIWFGAIKNIYKLEGGSIVPTYTAGSGTGFLSKDFPKEKSFLMMANLTIEELTSSVYSQAQSAENSITGFSLTNKTSSSSSISNGSFNNAKPSEYKEDTSDIDRPLSPADFSSVYGFGQKGWQSALAQGTVLSGIVNTNLWDTGNYLWDDLLNNPALLTVIQLFDLAKLKTIKVLNLDVVLEWNSVLMICNQDETAFGYYTPFKTLSSNSIYEIKVQVLTSSLTGGGKGASVYLVDSRGQRFTNYVLDSEGERIAPYESNALVYNPFYDETYDKDSDKYKNPSDQNDKENKLLRKGTKFVQANTIPALNPYYDENFDDTLTWKRETTKYYFLPNDEFKGDTDLYFNVYNPYATIKEYYEQQAEFKGIESDSKFTVFTFLVKTGYESLSLRLELWNGQRYLDKNEFKADYIPTKTEYEATYSKGIVFFDNAEMATVDKDDFYQFLFYEIKESFDEDTMYYNKDNTKIFDVAAYNRMANPNIADEEDVKEPDEKKDPEPFNWAALTAILVAAVLIFALGAVVVRKYFMKKKNEEKTVTVAPSYKRKTTPKQTSVNKTKKSDKE